MEINQLKKGDIIRMSIDTQNQYRSRSEWPTTKTDEYLLVVDNNEADKYQTVAVLVLCKSSAWYMQRFYISKQNLKYYELVEMN